MPGSSRSHALRSIGVACLLLAACAQPRPPAAAAQQWNPNAIGELATQGRTVYARTMSGRVWRWDTAEGTLRPLYYRSFVALARDGSVGVRESRVTRDDSLLEVRELATERLIRVRRFEGWPMSVYLATPHVVSITTSPDLSKCFAMGGPLPTPMPFYWDFDTDQFTGGRLRCEDHHRDKNAALSRDCGGFTSLSADGVTLYHSNGGRTIRSQPLGPDWQAAVTREKLAGLRTKPARGSSAIDRVSLAVTGDGRQVFVAYADSRVEHGCRLERWTPESTQGANGAFERLAEGRRHCGANLVAVSDDGSLVVMSGRDEPSIVRRAPDYGIEVLSDDAAAFAEFLAGDTRVVTVHSDARLRLWDAATLRLVAAVTLP